MLKIICAGLPRTGTTSLAEALRILGYKTLHGPTDRLPLFPKVDTSFRAYDDVDAVADLPAAMYWRELREAYPEAKVILTSRAPDAWYQSMVRHIAVMRAAGDRECDRLHTLVFGSAEPSEYWYKRRLSEHGARILWRLRNLHGGGLRHHLLMMDIGISAHRGTAWVELCDFLDEPIPECEFPWLNKRESDGLVGTPSKPAAELMTSREAQSRLRPCRSAAETSNGDRQ